MMTDLAAKPLVSKPALVRYAEAPLPTRYGLCRVRVYRFGAKAPDGEPAGDRAEEALAVWRGDLTTSEAVFARIHSECMTGEVLGSLKCDCRDQLEGALEAIHERGRGVLVYLRQEGRGIGLGNKIRAYALQNLGADTIEANHKLGFPTDLREFDVAAAILKDMGISRVELYTNNPAKLAAVRAHGIEVASRVPAHGALNPHNKRYLETKHRALGHDFAALLDVPADKKTAAE